MNWLKKPRYAAMSACLLIGIGAVALSTYVANKHSMPADRDDIQQQWADDQYRLPRGLEAYNRGDYLTALTLLLPTAKEGAAEAQFTLGTMYKNGEGVPTDDAAAKHWFELARRSTMVDANDGMRRAQVRLAKMLEIGLGGPKDILHAHMWFNIAASVDHTDNEYRLHFEGPFMREARTRRQMVELLMKPAEIARAQEMARRCLASEKKGCGAIEVNAR